MLPPDTVPFTRHTPQPDYHTGDLKLGHVSVLANLRRYLRISFDCLVKCVGAMPSQQDLQRIRNNLIESKFLTDDESGLRWTDFTPPATSKGSEENVFKSLGCIIARILAEVPNRGVSFVANPNLTPLSQRNNTSRPDGYLVLNNEKTQRKIHWFDIAVPFEFKNVRDIGSLRDDEEKIVWSLHSIMREDLLRRFAFGITIEDTQLRLWLSNRAFLAVTEPIDLFQNIDGVISLFYALGPASASSAMKELGWDPTVERIRDGEGFQYKFTIGDEVFTTTRESYLPSTGGIPGSGQLSTFSPIQLGNIARKDTGIPRRVHTRTIFHDVGVALNNITSLADILSCLSGALQALRYMHKAGWVHRDFSVGNAIWFGGMGKLSDFEYAKKMDSNTSHDARTGTTRFMAVEVESECYLSLSRHARRLDDRPSFRMNFLHDIESVWWVFTWILLYHTDTNTANADHSFDAHAQLKEYHLAFPGTVGRTSRRDFLYIVPLQTKLENVLSKTCSNVCSPIISDFADALIDSYEKAEANFPLLALDDALLDDIHTKAAAYLDDAQRRASGIELCPLSNLLKQKRPRPGDETSLPPNNQGKKARNA